MTFFFFQGPNSIFPICAYIHAHPHTHSLTDTFTHHTHSHVTHTHHAHIRQGRAFGGGGREACRPVTGLSSPHLFKEQMAIKESLADLRAGRRKLAKD